MTLQTQIENKINQVFSVTYMQLDNESHMHSGSNPETHFKLILVADDFSDMPKVKRHQAVYKALSDEMPLFHALALHTFAPDEWSDDVNISASPLCKGGSKKS